MSEAQVTDKLYEAVEKALIGVDPLERDSQLDDLRAKNGLESFLECLRMCFSHSQPIVRRRALEVFERLPFFSPTLMKEMDRCLTDREWIVREAALSALVACGRLNPDWSVSIAEILATGALNDPSAFVRDVAISYLGLNFLSQETICSLLKMSFSTNNKKVRVRALKVLEHHAKFFDQTLIDQVIVLLGDSSRKIRTQAVRTVQHVTDPRCLHMLVRRRFELGPESRTTSDEATERLKEWSDRVASLRALLAPIIDCDLTGGLECGGMQCLEEMEKSVKETDVIEELSHIRERRRVWWEKSRSLSSSKPWPEWLSTLSEDVRSEEIVWQISRIVDLVSTRI